MITIQGNPNWNYFEITQNGVTASYPSGTISLNYELSQTTKSMFCVFRTVSTNNVIAQTEPFNIINGTTGIAFTDYPSVESYVQTNFFSQAGGGTGNASTQPVGLLYNKAYWTALTDFTYSGFTPTVSNGNIGFTGGSNNYTQIMYINGYTSNDENIDVEVAFTIGTTGHGIGIGRNSVDVQSSCVIQFDETTNQLIFTSLQGTVQLTSQPANFTVANGDFCVLRYSQQGNLVTATFTDYSHTGGTFSYSVPLQTAGYTSPIPNTSDVCLYNIGGTRTIQAIIYQSRSLVNPDIIYNGDSKTVGLGTYGAQFRWANQLSQYGSFEVFAGGGDKVADLLAGQPYIINFIKPKTVLINVLRNDLSGGNLSPTEEANYELLVSNYQAAGITVFNLLPIPETVIPNQSAITTFLEATYPASSIIDPSQGAVTFNTSTMLAVDGIHLNVLGNTVVGANIAFANLLPLSDNVNPFIPADPILTFPITYTTGNVPFGQGTQFLTQSNGLCYKTNFFGINNTGPANALDVGGSGQFLANGASNVQLKMGVSAETMRVCIGNATTFSPDAAINDTVFQLSATSLRFLFNCSAGVSNAEFIVAHTVVTFGLAIKIAITEGTGGRSGSAQLSSGTVAITISGLTSSSRAFVQRTVASGTSLTTGETAVCTTNTLTITADLAAGTINTADNSTYNYVVFN